MATTRKWNIDGSYTDTTRTFDSQWGAFGPTTKEVVYADTHHITGAITRTTTTTKCRHNCWGKESLVVVKEEHHALSGLITTNTTITVTEATCFGPRTKTERKVHTYQGQPLARNINISVGNPRVVQQAEDAFNIGAFIAGGLMAIFGRK